MPSRRPRSTRRPSGSARPGSARFRSSRPRPWCGPQRGRGPAIALASLRARPLHAARKAGASRPRHPRPFQAPRRPRSPAQPACAAPRWFSRFVVGTEVSLKVPEVMIIGRDPICQRDETGRFLASGGRRNSALGPETIDPEAKRHDHRRRAAALDAGHAELPEPAIETDDALAIAIPNAAQTVILLGGGPVRRPQGETPMSHARIAAPEPRHPRPQPGQGDRPGAGRDREAVRQGLHHAARQERVEREVMTSSRPARSASTSRWASAACRAAASSRSTGRSRPARRR